jgi:D-alanyl-D-alanine endopeptidase (penicillin-binding protein 7)
MKWHELLYVGCWLVLGLVWGSHEAAASTPFSVSSKSAVVIDATTNEVVAGKDADTIRPIASITKLMTAIVVVESKLPMDEKITITYDDVQASSLRGHQSGGSLPVGTVITRENLLLLALMNSHNRAAAALGRSYPGGMVAFVQQMNTTARRLGMASTQFVEPTGLLAGNTSTAQDLALMVKHASQYAEIQRLSTSRKAVASYEYRDTSRDVQYGTTNRLLSTPNWDIDLQKTGYTGAAGRCVVMLTSIKENPFIVVLLNSASPAHRAADAIRIREWIETGSVPSARQVSALNPYKVNARHYKKHREHKRR